VDEDEAARMSIDDPDTFEHPTTPTPEPNVQAEFFGPASHFYRNYHTGLDGETFPYLFLLLAEQALS